MAAAMSEDVRGHLRTRFVCATQNVEQAGNTEMKKEQERNVFQCMSHAVDTNTHIQRESAVTLRDPRLLSKTNLNLSEHNEMS